MKYFKHAVHGYSPAAGSQEIAALVKAGFVECGPPPWPKNIDEEIDQKKKMTVSEAAEKGNSLVYVPDEQPLEAVQTDNELTREQLLELAEDSDVVIDRRWSNDKIKKALGL